MLNQMQKIAWLLCIISIGGVSASFNQSEDADIAIAGLFEVYNTENGKCKDLLPSSVQIVEAVKWTFEQLNKHNYIPGVKIGLVPYPTCGLVSKSSKKLIEILNSKDKYNCQNQHPPIVGIIGPSYSEEVKVTSALLHSIPAEERIPHIGFSATASVFEDNSTYPNFLSVIASDKIQVRVMVSLMKQLSWNYIAILYENDIYGEQGKDQLRKLAEENDICIAECFAINVSRNEGVSASDVLSILDNLIFSLQVKGVVFFGGSPVANVLLRRVKQLPYRESITFIFSEGMELKENTFMIENQVIEKSIGSYVVGPPKITPSVFNNYWDNLLKNPSLIRQEPTSNPFLLQAFEILKDCQSSDNRYCHLDQSLYVGYAIKAALTFGILLKEAHQYICGKTASNNCTVFVDTIVNDKRILLNKLHEFKQNETSLESTTNDLMRFLEFTTNDTQQTGYACTYDVYRVTENKSSIYLEKASRYCDDQLNMDPLLRRNIHETVKAECKEGEVCPNCIKHDYNNRMYVEEGDFYVVGVVPVCHESPDDQMDCKRIKTSNSVELAEAMAFGVKELNRDSEFFGNKKIGFVIINSCNQRLVVQHKLLDLLNVITFPNKSDKIIRDRILGFVGGFSSTVTIAMSDILRNLKFVHVGYASTATSLSNRSVHANFMRVVPPDLKQVKTFINLLKKLKNANYVQILYSDGDYGKSFREEFEKHAKQNNICIANSVKVINGRYSSIIDELRINPLAKVVIAVLQSYMAKGLSIEIKRRMNLGEFLFLGSVAWGNSLDIIDGNIKLIGSLKLSIEMCDIKGFNTYIKDIDIKTYKKNPWYKEYIEEKYGCYIEGSYNKTSKEQCRLDEIHKRYQREQWTSHAYHAIVTFLKGANETFYKLCGRNSTVLCEEYRHSPDTLISNIKDQKLDIYGDGNPVNVYDSNGDGRVKYNIYNIRRSKSDPQKVEYYKVAESGDGLENFTLNTEDVVLPETFTLPSTCPNYLKCGKCFGTHREIPQSESRLSNENHVAIGGMTSLSIVIIFLCIVLFVWWRKVRKENDETNTHPNNTPDHYDAPQDFLDIQEIADDIYQTEEFEGNGSSSYLTNNVIERLRNPKTAVGDQSQTPHKTCAGITFTNLGTV